MNATTRRVASGALLAALLSSMAAPAFAKPFLDRAGDATPRVERAVDSSSCEKLADHFKSQSNDGTLNEQDYHKLRQRGC